MLRRIGLICFDTVTALDLTGPAEVFSMANELCANSYELVMVGPALKPVRTDTGVRVLADVQFDDAPPLDTIFIPGGAALRDPVTAAPVVDWLRRRRQTRRIASVCTGLYALAATGSLQLLERGVNHGMASSVRTFEILRRLEAPNGNKQFIPPPSRRAVTRADKGRYRR